MYQPLFRDGRVLAEGETYKRPELARTLELIAQGGADAFYTGEVAEGLVKAVRSRDGVMTVEDLRGW